MHISEKIHKLRKDKGISQEKLGELLGVSRQTVYKWESGFIEPNKENIKALCKIFNVSKDYFYEEPLSSDAKSEVAATEIKIKKNKKLVIFTVLNSVVLFLLVFATVCIGFIANSTNKGDVYQSSSNIEFDLFLVFVILSICFAIIEMLLIIFTIRAKKRL